MKNLLNFTILFALGLFLILGCSGANQNATTPTNSASITTVSANTTAAPAAPTEKPIAVQARVMTKDYDENELAADGK